MDTLGQTYDVGKVESRARVTRIENGCEATAGREGFYHDVVHHLVEHEIATVCDEGEFVRTSSTMCPFFWKST